MKLKDFLIQQNRRNDYASKVFKNRIKKAILESLKEVIENRDMMTIDSRLDNLIKRQPIEDALRWLYITWGFQQFKWFKRNIKLGKKGSDDVWLQRLEEIFRKQGAEKVTEIIGTTLDLARPIIKEAVLKANQGLSIDKIQQFIKDELQGIGGAVSDGRARTIARTEVISASNQSTFEAVRSTGLKVEKKWITGGLNIRDSHRQAEKEGWIPFEDKFRLVNSSGGYDEMDHPGDPSGSAENVINCKCVLVFRSVE